MRNFVVYYHEELNLMFHHWEYVGEDFAADMAKCDNDPISKYNTFPAAHNCRCGARSWLTDSGVRGVARRSPLLVDPLRAVSYARMQLISNVAPAHRSSCCSMYSCFD